MDEIEELKIGNIIVIAKKCPNCGFIEFYEKSQRGKKAD